VLIRLAGPLARAAQKQFASASLSAASQLSAG